MCYFCWYGCYHGCVRGHVHVLHVRSVLWQLFCVQLCTKLRVRLLAAS